MNAVKLTKKQLAVLNYIEDFIEENPDQAEYYDLDGYIEGTLGGQVISGNFKGRIRTK